jgi:hypothetical protein
VVGERLTELSRHGRGRVGGRREGDRLHLPAVDEVPARAAVAAGERVDERVPLARVPQQAEPVVEPLQRLEPVA